MFIYICIYLASCPESPWLFLFLVIRNPRYHFHIPLSPVKIVSCPSLGALRVSHTVSWTVPSMLSALNPPEGCPFSAATATGIPSRLQYQFMQMEAQAQRPTQLTTPPGSQDTLSPAPTAHREKGSTHWTGGEWVAEGSG